MNKILITGANGFVGSHLIEHILSKHPDYEIIAMKRSHTSSMKNVEHITDKNLKWVICDLTDAHTVMKLFKEHQFEKVFHLAADSYVVTSFTQPTQTITTNVIGTINLLEAIKEYNKEAIVHICSSSEVYGNHTDKLKTEDEALNPSSPYGLSKVGEDMAGQLYHKMYGLKTVISRAYTHSGPRRGAAFFESAFAKQIAMIEKGLQAPIIKVGNLNSRRTMMDVRDMVRAYWILTEKGKYGEAYNLAGQEYWLVGSVLQHLISLSPMRDSIKVEVDSNLLRPTDIALQNPCLEKFNMLETFHYKYPIMDCLHDILDYWRNELQ